MKFKLVEAAESKICCICKKPFDGYGNNAEPVCSGSCCDECNMKEVIPARLKMLYNSSEEFDEDLEEGIFSRKPKVDLKQKAFGGKSYTKSSIEYLYAEEFKEECCPKSGQIKWTGTYNNGWIVQWDENIDKAAMIADAWVSKRKYPGSDDKLAYKQLNETDGSGDDEMNANCDDCGAVITISIDHEGPAYCSDCMKNHLHESLEDYKIIYYLATATAERRPETVEDVENDWKEDVFAADSDYDALLYALELIDSGYDASDFSTAEEIVEYFEEKDLGDGSAFVVKLEGPNGVIYDMGYDKQSYIDEFVTEDSYDDDDDSDEYLEEGIDIDTLEESIAAGIVTSVASGVLLDTIKKIVGKFGHKKKSKWIDYKKHLIEITPDKNINIFDVSGNQLASDLHTLKAAKLKIKELIKDKKNANKVSVNQEADNTLEEAIDPSKAFEVKENSDADVIFYGWQYKNEDPVEIDPEEWSAEEYTNRKNQIVNDYNKLNADNPKANRYAKEHDFIFYALYNRKNEELNEGRFDPYFTPYGYRAAAKVLNRTAPEYYWHLKEIEMDTGDGVKLANYALKKGLPVMLDKHSDPDYPEFYLKDGSSEYHWGDYFYTYGFTNPDATQLVPYEGNLDILNTEKDDNKMNEDMSIRAKLKALYPELDFGDDVNEGFDDDMEFDIDASSEYNFMEALYNGADFDAHDDEALEESSDCEDDECWENDLISDDYDDGM